MAPRQPGDAHLLWHDEAAGGNLVQVVRHAYHAGDGWAEHDHNFAEVFWVERGTGWQVINGREGPLQAGDCWFLRPQDRHASRAGPEGMAIINVSFFPAEVSAFALRHHDCWPWRESGEPLHRLLPQRRRERLFEWAEELSHGRNDSLDLEAFLADVMRMCQQPAVQDPLDPLPLWLQEALIQVAEPRHLVDGCTALTRLAGRSLTHINRVLRQCTGQTATAMITALRLDHAAALLRMTDRRIPAIGTAIGLPNLGHFYQCFQQRFGTTPARYRRQVRSSSFGDRASS